jgi:hypothetical protein
MNCTACGRTLRNQPVMVGDKPFGRRCAAKARLDLFSPTRFAQELADRAMSEIRSDFALARARMESFYLTSDSVVRASTAREAA